MMRYANYGTRWADILRQPGPQKYSLPRGPIAVVFYIKASFRLPSSRPKVKVKGTPVSAASCWLISMLFHIRAPVPFFPWQSGLQFPRYNLTLKIQGQRYPNQRCIQLTHFLSVSQQGILSTPIPFVPWQSGPHSRDTIWPWKFKVKGQGQRYISQRRIQLTHFLFVSHRLDQPFLRYGK